MAKLTFNYGTMASGKTLRLLSEVHDLTKVGADVVVLKPEIDTRTTNTVRSRLGVEKECYVLKKDDNVFDKCEGADYIYVDESQFLTEEQIDQLRELADKGFEVVCFGLLTTFQRKLFKGSKRLIEVADEIVELKGICEICGAKATVNIRMVDGKIQLEGEEIVIGDEEYKAICSECFRHIK